MNGNTLAYPQTLAELTTVTTYTYDATNQLMTAHAESDPLTWHYTFDANGSLTDITPNGTTPANGARRYTYSPAGYLLQVETHDGTAYQPQAEMVYNGLGQRLSMTAHQGELSLTTQYLLDLPAHARPLSATANNQTTFYLYGNGSLAEQTAQWTYSLVDGTRTARQLTNPAGAVTLARRYTPWGEVLEQAGDGDFTWGYFGGLLDAATGLIYVGSGQYYDPATGRFLSRFANPGATNPYLPQRDPLGALLGPAMLLFLLQRRRKKPGKYDHLVIGLVLVLALGMSLAACGDGTGTPGDGTPSPTLPTTPPSGGGTPLPPATEPPSTPTPPPASPTPLPLPDCPTALTKNWLPNEFVITHYATVLESDSFFPDESGNVPIYNPTSGDISYSNVPKWRFYVGNDCDGNCGNWRVSFQGSGKLTEPASLALSGGKQYVQADTKHLPPPDPANGYQPSASYYFVDQPQGACGTPLEVNASIAVASNLFGSPGHSCGDKYYIDIPGFENKIFTVKDTGSFVAEPGQPDHFDIYVGAQNYDNYYNNPEFTKYDGKTFRVASAQP